MALTLPLNWLYFNGELSQQDAVLTWGVSEQANNNYFFIEKSKDGLTFEPMVKLNSNENNALLNQQYQWIDHQPYYTTYYRISETDIDGRTNMYKTIRLSSSEHKLAVCQIVFSTMMGVRIENAPIGNGFIEIYSLDGKLVSSTPIIINGESNEFSVRKPIETALYLMRILINTETIYHGKVLMN